MLCKMVWHYFKRINVDAPTLGANKHYMALRAVMRWCRAQVSPRNFVMHAGELLTSMYPSEAAIYDQCRTLLGKDLAALTDLKFTA